MGLLQIMHVKTKLLNNVSKVGPSERHVLKGARETPKLCGIHHRRVEVGGELGLKIHMCGVVLAICDSPALKNVTRVEALMQEELIGSLFQESGEEISCPHCKFQLQS
jgi:hypothetical protein